VAKKIHVPTNSCITIRQEILDFLAAVPQKFTDKIEHLEYFFGRGEYTSRLEDHKEFDELCQKNPMYYKELEFYVTYKDKGYYKQVIENSEIGDIFKQCFVITKCCSKGLITRTDAKVLKELAGLVRLYSYDRDKIIDCILDSK
jgi:hypothetical protein